ncbi:MAG: PqqD family protein [Myxococcota bacterium]|nr:PqqD family protein [Myxococcota bacterium]
MTSGVADTKVIEWDLVVVPHARVASRVVAGQALILDPRNDALQRLNEVGSFVWSKIAERSHTFEAIANLMAEEFESDAETIRADLRIFAEELLTRDCITYATP